MFFKLPPDVTSFGWGGNEYTPDKKGIIEIEAEAKEQAERHGLVEVGKPATKGE